jgi:major membrane immunogen (membrane-anchored lipoprotein)
MEEPDHFAKGRRANRCEYDLSNRQGRAASEDGDNERADYTGAAMEGGEARCHAREVRERADCEREQQPAEEADAENIQIDA